MLRKATAAMQGDEKRGHGVTIGELCEKNGAEVPQGRIFSVFLCIHNKALTN